MANLDPVRVVEFAKDAGFRYGDGLDVIVAIAFAETDGTLDPTLTNTAGNTPADSVDRGILMLNSHWHAEVTDACAFDPACAFHEGRRIWKEREASGRDPGSVWATYNSGKFRFYMPAARVARRLQEALTRNGELIARNGDFAAALDDARDQLKDANAKIAAAREALA